MNILIAAGGTGGHIFPGMALAEAFIRAKPQAAITFVGTERGLESRVLAGRWPLATLRSRSLKDRRGFKKLLACGSLPLACCAALKMLWRLKPALVVGIGGYAAGPLLLMAALANIPTAIVEPNAYAGFTNRILGKVVRRVFLQFAEAARFFAKHKVSVSGSPLRPEIEALQGKERMNAADPLTIYCLGGSQGARSVNRAVVAALEELGSFSVQLRVLHQAGTADDVEALRAEYRRVGVDAQVLPFSTNIAAHYAAADLVIARAGAATIAELVALALPAILIPYPYAADDHQRYNALAMVRRGYATMILEDELSGARLGKELREFLLNPEKLAALRANLRRLPQGNAAARIVEECFNIMRRERCSDAVNIFTL